MSFTFKTKPSIEKIVRFQFFFNRGTNVKIDDDEVINRVNCYCHLLNNIVSNMCAIASVKILIDNTSSLVSFVRNSGLGSGCEPQLKKFITTRGNSVYDMLSTVNLNYSKIGQILLDKEVADRNSSLMHKLTVIPRTDSEIVAEFLKPFKDWTKQLEFEAKPTLWMVWLIFIQLNKYLLEKASDSVMIKDMKASGREYIEKNKSDIEPKMVHKISTVLNPLLKNIAMATNEEREHIYGLIDARIQKCDTNSMANMETENMEENANVDVLDDFMGSVSAEGTSSNIGHRSKELETYLNAKMPRMNPFDFDLVEWWFGNRYTYPNLFRYFISLAGICAASSPSERSFSETGVIITARRANLLPDTVSDLVLARNKFLEFL